MKYLEAATTPAGTVKIFLDDVEITDVCFYAEVADLPGYEIESTVKVFQVNNSGVIVKVETKTGRVRWEAIL